jgi:hypothetical protein
MSCLSASHFYSPGLYAEAAAHVATSIDALERGALRSSTRSEATAASVRVALKDADVALPNYSIELARERAKLARLHVRAADSTATASSPSSVSSSSLAAAHCAARLALPVLAALGAGECDADDERFLRELLGSAELGRAAD